MNQPDRKIIAEKLLEELVKNHPVAFGARYLSSGSYGHTFLFRDEVTVAKIRSGRPEDETHEGHNLKCLLDYNHEGVMIPEYRGEIGPFGDKEEPYVATLMSRLMGGTSSEQKFNGSYERLGKYLGKLHRLFNRASQVSNGLRVSEQYKKENPSGLLREKFSRVGSSLIQLGLLRDAQERQLQNALESYLVVPPKETWIHGDFGWQNILFYHGWPRVVDFGYMHPARHPEIEFYYFYPRHWDDLIKGYKATSGIELDRRLLASLDLMYYVGDVAECFRQPQKKDYAFKREIEKAINMMNRRLTTPSKFYGDHIPYGLEG